MSSKIFTPRFEQVLARQIRVVERVTPVCGSSSDKLERDWLVYGIALHRSLRKVHGLGVDFKPIRQGPSQQKEEEFRGF